MEESSSSSPWSPFYMPTFPSYNPTSPAYSRDSPPGHLVKTRPPTEHRRYHKITATSATATASNMNFGLQTARRVLLDALSGGKGSVMCSPISIAAVLNILAACARGEMLEQLLRVLECDDVADVNAAAVRFMEVLKGSDDEDGPDISFANALWVAKRFSIRANLRDVLSDVHKVEVRGVDFQNQGDQVVKEANLWAEEKTKGMIKQILSRDAISEDTMMILVNALYFKGVWVDTFKRKHTKDKDFHLLNGKRVQAPFMTQYGHFDYGTFENCKVLRMLYREGDDHKPKEGEKPKSFSMYIFLPDEKDGLSNFMENVKIDANMFKDQIKMDYVEIEELSIPKFSFECDFSLTEPMKKLGLTLPFMMECKDLLGMVESSNSGDWPYVNDVFQKCRIEVNEKGTKAATLTRIQLAPGYGPPSTPPPPVYFVADHPFMFMIREDFSGAILFVGTVLDPRSA